MTLPLDFGALGAAMERVEMERRAGVKRTPEETKAALRAALAAGPTGPSDHGALIAAADALRAADAALLAATQRCDAAHEAVLARLRWQGERQRQRQGFAGVAAEWLDDSPESAAIARERGEARSARGDAEAAVSAAVRGLTAVARGER